MTSPTDVAEAIHAFNEGVRAMQEGDSEAAADAWKRAAELDPGMTPALKNLVVYYEERDKLAEVIAAYDRILAFDPFDTEALVRQASAYHRTGRAEAAIANYEKAIAIYPYFRFWYAELATIYDQIDETDTGEAWRARSMELDANEAEMAFEDGIRQHRAGNDELALAIFEAVVDEVPANTDARIRLARLLQTAGRTDEAIAQLDRALELSDVSPALVLFHRARIRATAGDIPGACEDLAAALEDEPDYGRARRLLERLGSSGGTPPGKSADIPPVPDRTGGASEEASSSQMGALAPRLPAPDPDLPWIDQVRLAVEQACRVESRTGQPGRAAVLLAANAWLAPIAQRLLAELVDPELGLIGDQSSRVYVIEGEPAEDAGKHGLIAEGWFGVSYSGPSVDRWRDDADGLPLDRMLEAAQLAVGSDGFNILVFVSDGRVRSDQNSTLSYLHHVPTYQVLCVEPSGADAELENRLTGHAPNLLAIAVPADDIGATSAE